MKIALQIPLRHWDDFIELTDFDVALIQYIGNEYYVKLYEEATRHGRETWLNNGLNETGRCATSEQLMEGMDIFNPTHIVCAEDADPDFNVSMVMSSVQKFYYEDYDKGKVGVWHGEKRHLKFLSQQCDIVGLPWRYFRQKYIDIAPKRKLIKEYLPVQTEYIWNNSKNFHYFGFRNLDELRRFPPRSIDTDVPIVAASMGVDLRDRVRRPKNLPKYDPDLKLSRAQVKLAKQNIIAIKEAGNGM